MRLVAPHFQSFMIDSPGCGVEIIRSARLVSASRLPPGERSHARQITRQNQTGYGSRDEQLWDDNT
jgi:hypothetical protein